DGPGPREADLPPQRPRLPADGRLRQRGEGDSRLTVRQPRCPDSRLRLPARRGTLTLHDATPARRPPERLPRAAAPARPPRRPTSGRARLTCVGVEKQAENTKRRPDLTRRVSRLAKPAWRFFPRRDRLFPSLAVCGETVAGWQGGWPPPQIPGKTQT